MFSNSIKKIPLFYKRCGEGSPILLLHGFMENVLIWQHFIKVLSSDFTIVAPDLPGHGQSCKVDATSISDMATTIGNLVIEQKLNDITVVGHSMGGYVALKLAILFPDIIKKVILLHSTPMEDSEAKKKDRNRAVKVIRRDMSLFIQTAVPNLFYNKNVAKFTPQISEMIKNAEKMEVETVAKCMLAIRDREDMRSTTMENNIPVHCILGDHDNTLPVEVIVSGIKDYPNYSHTIVKNTGHMSFYEAPEIVLKEIRNAIASTILIK